MRRREFIAGLLLLALAMLAPLLTVLLMKRSVAEKGVRVGHE